MIGSGTLTGSPLTELAFRATADQAADNWLWWEALAGETNSIQP